MIVNWFMEKRLLAGTSAFNVKQHMLAPLFVFLLSTSSANALIMGDQFQVDAEVNGISAGPSVFGIAGQAGSDAVFPFDFIIEWFDDDSFDIEVITTNSLAGGAEVTLSDLNFKNLAGDATPIVGAMFNSGDSLFDTFFMSPDNPTGAPPAADPSVSFTDTSVSVFFGDDWVDQLIADQPILRFDVKTGSRGEPVPEPSIAGLLMFGLVTFGLARRMRRV